MAEKRMFSKQIIDSDAFLDMALSTQALYFHLCMRADDDGFVNNPKRIMRLIGSADDEYKVLFAKKFIIPFESGVCVIKHWKIHNYIQNDRYKETTYQDEKHQLGMKENKAYTLMDTECIQNGYNLDTTCTPSIDKNSIVEISVDKNSKDKSKKEKIIYMDLTFIDDVIEKVKLTKEQYDKLINKFNKELIHKTIIALDTYIANGTNKYKDHYRTINNWCNSDKGGNNNNGQFSKNTATSKKYNLKREEFDASKYDTSQGDMPV